MKNLEKRVRILDSHIKIRLCGNFHENLGEKYLAHFLRHF